MVSHHKKRAAAVAALEGGAATKRRSAKTELQSRLNVVTSALSKETLMPSSVTKVVLDMLARGVPAALSSSVEERHAMQTTVITHIHDIFLEASSSIEASASEGTAEANAMSAQLEKENETVQACLLEFNAATSLVEDQNKKVKEVEERVKLAVKDLKAVEAQQKANLRERANFEREQAKFRALEEGTLNVLVEGACGAEKETKKATSKLVRDLEKFGAEPSLVASVPSVLLKRPEERKGFDEMVVASLRAFLEEKVAALGAAIRANEEAAAALDAAAAEKQEATDAARRAGDVEAEELHEVKAVLTDKQSAYDRSRGELEFLHAAIQEGLKKANRAKADAEQLREARDSLEFLTLRTAAAVESGAAEGAGAGEAADAPTLEAQPSENEGSASAP